MVKKMSTASLVLDLGSKSRGLGFSQNNLFLHSLLAIGK